MNRFRINYHQAVFLYAYLNQIDLSLDRSRWVSIDELREYYKTQIAPGKVAHYLMQNFELDTEKFQYLYFVERLSFLDRIKTWISLNFKKESFLTSNQLYYCCQKLLALDSKLNSNDEIHKLEIEKLRIELSKLTYGIIKYKLHQEDRNRAMKVEHFLQNESLDVIRMEEFSSRINL